jgi:hypothetical protein
LCTKFQAVLKRNPGFSTFASLCQVFNWDDVDPPEDIAPEKMPLLIYAPVISCDVEKSFQPTNRFYQIKHSQWPEKLWKWLCIVHQKINDCANICK